MQKVRFGDVAERINIHVDQQNTDLEYYIGGEHIESCEFMIHSKAPIKGATIGYQFQFGFEPNDILFMTKNPHLRKASMVDFRGLCSIATFVIRTKDKSQLLQEYLLLEMQSDRFWQYLEENKSGGVNYFINWGTLSNYMFELPDMSKQKELSKKVWSAYRVKEAYKKLLVATDEMVKSQFIEMFDKVKDNKYGYMSYRLSDCCSYISDGSHYSPKEDPNGQYPMLSVKDMTEKGFTYKDCKYISKEEYDKLVANGCKPEINDVLVAKDGSYFKYSFALIEAREQAVLSSIAILRPNPAIVDSRYLAYYMLTPEVIRLVEQNYLTGTAIKRVILKGFKEIPVLTPPLDKQQEFVSILQQADKSKFELRKSIDAIDTVIKSLING